MAVTLTAAELAEETSASVDRATRVLAVATEAVTHYAPEAPEVLQNEAVLRFAGYLLGSDYGAIRKDSIGPSDYEFVTNHAAMFRNSGAAALLTRYRIRRAGSIAGSSE